MMNSIARTLQKTILIFSASVLSLLSLPSFAQMSIEITGVGQSLYPIAVMRFKDESKLPTSVTEIIRQDLARSGYFKNIENGNASESAKAPNYNAWAARGANALVVGSVVQKGVINLIFNTDYLISVNP
jgi:TolB protein